METTFYEAQARALALAMSYAKPKEPVHMWGELDDPSLYRLGWARRCDDLKGDELVVVHTPEECGGVLVCSGCGDRPGAFDEEN